MRNDRSKLKTFILQMLSDGKEHSTTEISRKAAEKGIISQDDNALIRGIVYLMKKDNPNISSAGRGKYILIAETSQQNVHDDMKAENNLRNFVESIMAEEDVSEENRAILLKKILDFVRNEETRVNAFDWKHCSDFKEFERMREEALLLEEFQKEAVGWKL